MLLGWCGTGFFLENPLTEVFVFALKPLDPGGLADVAATAGDLLVALAARGQVQMTIAVRRLHIVRVVLRRDVIPSYGIELARHQRRPMIELHVL